MKGAAGEVPASAPEVGSVLSNCSRMTHLVVIRATATKKPKVVGGLNQFEGGTASGDVMIFELAKGKSSAPRLHRGEQPRSLDEWKNFASDPRTTRHSNRQRVGHRRHQGGSQAQFSM